MKRSLLISTAIALTWVPAASQLEKNHKFMNGSPDGQRTTVSMLANERDDLHVSDVPFCCFVCTKPFFCFGRLGIFN